MIEKFDFDVYEKTNYGLDEYILPNGNTIYSMGYSKNKGSFQYERLPKPSFCTVSKEFYPNGNLKKKETYIGGDDVKVDTSYYYAEDGSLIKQVDENFKFGKIKPQDALNFLQEKGYIDLKTGKGRIDEDGNPVFLLAFVNEKGEKYWIITIVNGKHNDSDPSTFDEEPPAYLPIHYYMDGETGKVTDQDPDAKDPKEDKKVYREYKGRKFYSEQEWKDFADEDVKVWAKKNNVKLEDEPLNNHYKPQWFISERKENEKKK